MLKKIKEKTKTHGTTAKHKDDVICYIVVEVVLCR